MTPTIRILARILVVAGTATLILSAVVALRAVGGEQTVIVNQTGPGQREGVTASVGGGNLAGPNGALVSGTGLIVGQTMEGATSRPVGGALVTLRVPGVVPLRVLSDGQGRFVFRDLPKGSFSLDAVKNGYADGAFGRTHASGDAQPVVLGDGDRLSNVNVSLWKYASVSGTVIDEAGEPKVGTTVRVIRKTIVNGVPRLSLGAVDQTDDRGMYRIGGLEPGEVLVSVPIVTDAAGNLAAALRDLEVRAATLVSQRIEFAAAGGGGGGGDFTAAAPFISLTGGGDASATTVRGEAYPTQSYPSAAMASRATMISLGAGDDRTGIDFQLRPVAISHVSGVITGPTGPGGNVTVDLLPADSEGLLSPLDQLTTRADPSGGFTFSTVVPGQYVIRVVRAVTGPANLVMNISGSGTAANVMVQRVVAPGGGGGGGGVSPPLPADPTLWAEMPVSVGDADLAGIAVALRTGAKVTGQIEWNGAAAKPATDAWPNIGLTLMPADTKTAAVVSSLRGRVETNGTFTTIGAPPGRYFVQVNGAPQGWFFRGAVAGGRDVTDQPLEIGTSDIGGVVLTFTDKQTTLSGTVTDANGAPDATAAAIVFPTERDSSAGGAASPRRLRNVRVNAKGAFTISGLPAGRYYLTAVHDAITGNWQDPAFLTDATSGATTIDIAEGQTLTQSLKVVR